MNKFNILILSFLTVTFLQTNAMHLRDHNEERTIQAAKLAHIIESIKLTNKIKKQFFNLDTFDSSASDEDKIETIVELLQSYQAAHEALIHDKLLCNSQVLDPQILSPKLLEYLRPYKFCDMSIQDNFQAKADSLLGGYELDMHQWFEEMRSMEYEAFFVPYRFYING